MEIKKASVYGMLNNTQKASHSRLSQGTLVVQHPVFTDAPRLGVIFESTFCRRVSFFSSR